MPQLKDNSAQPNRPADTSEICYQRLIAAIVSLDLKPGEPVREARIARDWGVSRSPVREAVRRAAALGLIELRPNRAPVIRAFDARDAQKIYQVREHLELLALELALPQLSSERLAPIEALFGRLDALGPDSADWRTVALILDQKLHGLWMDHCENPWLRGMLEQLWTLIQILQELIARNPEALSAAIAEHRILLKAVQSGQLDAARSALSSHLKNALRHVQAHLSAHHASGPRISSRSEL